jgi:hypothetical protein
MIAYYKIKSNTYYMSNVSIPEIDLPTSVSAVVGENVKVNYYKTVEDIGKMSVSSYDIVEQVIGDVFRNENIHPDRNLEMLCHLIGRSVIKKLATMPGLLIEFGGSPGIPPREIIDVNLRPAQTVLREAEVIVDK